MKATPNANVRWTRSREVSEDELKWARQEGLRESRGKEVSVDVREGGRLGWCRRGSLVGARW